MVRGTSSNIGVRQGDSLIPHLFKANLPEMFYDTCDPATLSDIKLNSLMFADDVVLLSTSEKGNKPLTPRSVNFRNKAGCTTVSKALRKSTKQQNNLD
jgi:hypothetical protein